MTPTTWGLVLSMPYSGETGVRGAVFFDADGTLVPDSSSSQHLAGYLGHLDVLRRAEDDYADQLWDDRLCRGSGAACHVQGPRACGSKVAWQSRRVTFFADAEPMPKLPWAPPRNRVPVPVAWHFVLARTADTVVAVTGVSAAPEGVRFSLVTMLRPVDGGADEGLFGDGFPSGLRFGVRLPDGNQVLRGGEPARDAQRVPTPPGFHLSQLGGSAGSTESQEDLWLWPMPGPGTLVFACTWPSRGVQESLAETSTSALLEAAVRAEELWSLPALVEG